MGNLGFLLKRDNWGMGTEFLEGIGILKVMDREDYLREIFCKRGFGIEVGRWVRFVNCFLEFLFGIVYILLGLLFLFFVEVIFFFEFILLCILLFDRLL